MGITIVFGHRDNRERLREVVSDCLQRIEQAVKELEEARDDPLTRRDDDFDDLSDSEWDDLTRTTQRHCDGAAALIEEAASDIWAVY